MNVSYQSTFYILCFLIYSVFIILFPDALYKTKCKCTLYNVSSLQLHDAVNTINYNLPMVITKPLVYLCTGILGRLQKLRHTQNFPLGVFSSLGFHSTSSSSTSPSVNSIMFKLSIGSWVSSVESVQSLFSHVYIMDGLRVPPLKPRGGGSNFFIIGGGGEGG